MTADDNRCTAMDPVWDQRCTEAVGHDGVHHNAETTGETIAWGTAAQIREYERSRKS